MGKSRKYLIFEIDKIYWSANLLEQLYYYGTDIVYFGVLDKKSYLASENDAPLNIIFTSLTINDIKKYILEESELLIKLVEKEEDKSIDEAKSFFSERRFNEHFLNIFNISEKEIKKIIEINIKQDIIESKSNNIIQKEADMGFSLDSVREKITNHVILKNGKEPESNGIEITEKETLFIKNSSPLIIKFIKSLLKVNENISSENILNILVYLNETPVDQELFAGLAESPDGIADYFVMLNPETDNESAISYFFYKKNPKNSICFKDNFEISIEETNYYNRVNITFSTIISRVKKIGLKSANKIVIELQNNLYSILNMNNSLKRPIYLVLITEKNADSIIFQ